MGKGACSTVAQHHSPTPYSQLLLLKTRLLLGLLAIGHVVNNVSVLTLFVFQELVKPCCHVCVCKKQGQLATQPFPQNKPLWAVFIITFLALLLTRSLAHWSACYTSRTVVQPLWRLHHLPIFKGLLLNTKNKVPVKVNQPELWVTHLTFFFLSSLFKQALKPSTKCNGPSSPNQSHISYPRPCTSP